MTRLKCDSPSQILKIFDNNYCYLLDGGLASQLEANGHTFSDHDPLWSSKLLVTDPEAIVHVHKQHLEAGANIITTNSYQASIDGFKLSLGLDKNDALKAIANSVSLAHMAIKQVSQLRVNKINGASATTTHGCITTGSDPTLPTSAALRPVPKSHRPLVAGSVGPYGASLCDGSEYTGSYARTVSRTFLSEWHRPRIVALLGAGADILAVETLPCLKEALAVMDVLDGLGWPRPAWVSFTLKPPPAETGGSDYVTCISEGRPFAEAYAALSAYPSVVAVGANCVHPDAILDCGTAGAGASGKGLIFYPNSGELWDHVNRSWYGTESCIPLGNYVPSWLRQGARIVGGCCRVLDGDVAGMRLALDTYLSSSPSCHE